MVHSDNFLELKDGIDKHFFKRLYELYKPFLSSSHTKDKYQYTIYFKNCEAGFLQISSKPAHFIQIALDKKFWGFNLCTLSIQKMTENLKYSKLGWSAYKYNLPSLKLLYKLGGGVLTGSMKSTTKKAEGYFFIDKQVDKTMRENLESLISKSNEQYQDWYKKMMSKIS